MVIKRVGPLSCAKVAGTLYAFIGLLLGAVVSLISFAGSALSGNSDNAAMGAMLGAGAIVLFPILYGALGFVATLIGAALYNFAAGIVGGIEIEVQ